MGGGWISGATVRNLVGESHLFGDDHEEKVYVEDGSLKIDLKYRGCECPCTCGEWETSTVVIDDNVKAYQIITRSNGGFLSGCGRGASTFLRYLVQQGSETKERELEITDAWAIGKIKEQTGEWIVSANDHELHSSL